VRRVAAAGACARIDPYHPAVPLVDASRQRTIWEARAHYRDPRDPVAEAFAVPKVAWLADRLGLGPSSSVLDVGAGNGMFTWWWARRVGRVEGVEQSRNMIERSPVQGLLRHGDAYELPYPDGSFDATFAGNVLHHLERPVDALREMARVSKGAVAVCEGNRNHLPMGAFGMLSRTCRGVVVYSGRHLRRLAEEAGLEVVDARAHGYVYENRSPRFSLPVAARVERASPGGAYLLLAARKPGTSPTAPAGPTVGSRPTPSG
jgi:SAM-dependent methyltransferase